MDLTPTIIPKADQINADDLMTGPRTVTIIEVKKGSAEQPVNIVTEEFGPARPYKPGKSMRRVLVACWGPEASAYVGRKMTLFTDPTIRFGGQAVGGIRIAALSHLDATREINLTVTRGKREPFTVQPLGPARDWAAELETANGDPGVIRTLGTQARAAGASEDVLAALTEAFKTARAAQIGGEA
jgi:hypothetical protein